MKHEIDEVAMQHIALQRSGPVLMTSPDVANQRTVSTIHCMGFDVRMRVTRFNVLMRGRHKILLKTLLMQQVRT